MGYTVLIVDDDAGTRLFLSTVLERSGHDVIATESVEEGKALLEKLRPDLLIADVRIGAFNGLQLVAVSPRPVPTIIMTGFPDPVIEAEALRHGASFVLKPIKPAVLLTLVGELLHEAASCDPAS